MELHAFERMAQRAETNLFPDCAEEELQDGLMPQPMTSFPAVTPTGMAYVPYQLWSEPYDADTGFSRGTMFPELDLPFAGGEHAE